MSSSSSNRSFWPAFQRRWAAALCEQTEGLGAWSDAMSRALGRGIIEVPNSAEARAALDQLNARLGRLESARLSDTSVPHPPLDGAMRAHFVRYGAALLSASVSKATSPESVVPTGLDYAQLHLMIDNLCDWLRLLKLMPSRVFCLDDFDSQIIGRAVAQQLQINSEVADGNGFAHSRSLIVSADSRALTAPHLNVVFPAQVLFALNLHRPTGAIAPDVASCARTELVLPWHGERVSPCEIADIAERISNANLRESNGEWSSLLEFYRARRELLTAGNSAFTRLFMFPEFT